MDVKIIASINTQNITDKIHQMLMGKTVTYDVTDDIKHSVKYNFGDVIYNNDVTELELSLEQLALIKQKFLPEITPDAIKSIRLCGSDSQYFDIEVTLEANLKEIVEEVIDSTRYRVTKGTLEFTKIFGDKIYDFSDSATLEKIVNKKLFELSNCDETEEGYFQTREAALNFINDSANDSHYYLDNRTVIVSYYVVSEYCGASDIYEITDIIPIPLKLEIEEEPTLDDDIDI